MGKIIQVENSSANIALALREQLKRVRICISDSFDTPQGRLHVSKWAWRTATVRKGAPVDRFVLSREPFSSDPIEERLPAHKVQFIQAVEVGLSTEAQLLGWSSGDVPVTQTLALGLLFDIRVAASPNEVFLVIEFEGIDGLPDLPEVAALKTRISSLFPLQKLPLDVGTLSGLGGSPVVANAGISGGNETDDSDLTTMIQLDLPSHFLTDMSIVLIRIEIGAYPVNTGPWADFYSSPQQSSFATGGRNRPGPPTLPWFVFVDQFFITERTRQSAEDGFSASGKFKLQGGIATSWSSTDGRPIATLDFYGTAIDACDLGVFGSSNMDLHVNAPVELSVIEPPSPFTPPVPNFQQGILQQNIKVNYRKSDWDTAACLLSAVSIWPYLGLKLMEEDRIEWPEYLGGLLSKSLLTIFALKYINKGGLAPSPGQTCTRPDPDKDEFVCVQPFDPGVLQSGGMPQLTDLMGRPDGLVLIGSMFWMERLARRFKLVSVEVNPFAVEVPQFSCAAASAAGLSQINSNPKDFVDYEATIYLNFDLTALSAENTTAIIGFSKTDRLAPYVCEARVRPEDDPLNVFAPFVSVDDSSPFLAYVRVRVPVNSVPPAYFTNAYRYPCRVLIQTSSGTRLVDIAPMTEVTNEDVKSMTLEAWAQRVSQCKARSRAYDPAWSIDPPEVYRDRHYWEIVVAGLAPREQVTLQDRQRTVVAESRADERGVARLQALLSPESYDGQLSFSRESPPAETASDRHNSDGPMHLNNKEIRIDATQIQLLQVGEIVTEDAIISIAPVILGARQGIVIADGRSVSVYDLELAEAPRLLGTTQLPDISDLTRFSSGLVGSSCAGAFDLKIDHEHGDIAVSQQASSPVAAAAADHERFTNGGKFDHASEAEPVLRLGRFAIEIADERRTARVYRTGRVAKV